MSVLKIILTPTNYLLIAHPEKRWFDFILPIFFAIAVSMLIYLIPVNINVLDKGGVISLVNGILQILSGFYIASMAAVSTFQKEGMDDIMPGVSPKLNGIPLTKRKFLAYLFGYLAISCIALYFIGGAAQLLSEVLATAEITKHVIIRYLSLSLYLFFLFNIILTTILGMYFLIDNIHQEKNKLTIKHKD